MESRLERIMKRQKRYMVEDALTAGVLVSTMLFTLLATPLF